MSAGEGQALQALIEEPVAPSPALSPRAASFDHWAGNGESGGQVQPSGVQPSGANMGNSCNPGDHRGHVYSRLRGANPAGRLRPIRLRPEDEDQDDENIGACKQQ